MTDDSAVSADEAQHQFAVDCRDCEFGFSTELYAERDYHANQHEQKNPGHEVVLDGRSPNTGVREDQPQLVTDGGEVEAEEVYRYNGHEFEVILEYEGDKTLQCRDCLIKENLREGDDPKDHLELMTPECHIEWLREPDGGFHGIALRNKSGFSGRELIGVRTGGETGEGKVVDKVRIYDDDAAELSSLLDPHERSRREEVLHQ